VQIRTRPVRWQNLLILTVTIVLAAASAAVSAVAGPAPGLCKMNTYRGAVPAKFFIDACIDGNNIWLYNTSTLVLRVARAGAVRKPHKVPSDLSLAADATRRRHGGEWVLMPGDKMQIPIGSGAAAINIGLSGPGERFYALANTVETFWPFKDRIDEYATLVADLNADFIMYKNCRAEHVRLGTVRCFAQFAAHLSATLAKVALAAAGKLLSTLLAENTFYDWLKVQIPQVSSLLHSPEIKQAKAGPVSPSPSPSPTASASPTPTPTAPGPSSWSATEAPVPADAGSRDALLQAVSCTSSSSCMAGGFFNPPTSGMLLSLTGSKWNAVDAPVPINGAASDTVYGISCASANECISVGYLGYADYSGLLLKWSSDQWSAFSQAPLPPNAFGGRTLNAVACPDVSDCVAVGSYYLKPDVTTGLLSTWSAGAWEAAEAPLPTNVGGEPNAEVNGVSCPSSNECLAVGDYQDSSADQAGMFLKWSDGSWTASEAPIPSSPGRFNEQLHGISCSSDSACVAVGSLNGQSLLLVFSDGTWRTVNVPVPVGGDPLSSVLDAVACPATSNCIAGGSSFTTSAARRPLLVTLSGGNWTSAWAPVPGNASSSEDGDVNGISCPSTTVCIAVGDYLDPSGTFHGLILKTDGTP
jgi:hypothetical protein